MRLEYFYENGCYGAAVGLENLSANELNELQEISDLLERNEWNGASDNLAMIKSGMSISPQILSQFYNNSNFILNTEYYTDQKLVTLSLTNQADFSSKQFVFHITDIVSFLNDVISKQLDVDHKNWPFMVKSLLDHSLNAFFRTSETDFVEIKANE
jgi:hypothetical protein